MGVGEAFVRPAMAYGCHWTRDAASAAFACAPSFSVTIVNTRPTDAQQINGRIVPVSVRFVQFDTDVAFSTGNYDRSRPLLIDVLQRSTR